MKAKTYLGLIKKLNMVIRNKELEKEELMTLATKTTQELSDMPHGSGTSDKVGNLSTKILMKEQEIDHVINIFVDLKDEIIEQIQKLPADEYDVIHSHYVLGERLSDIAERRGQSDTWIKDLKNRGINHINIIESAAYKEACNILFS